ncbi:MAG: flagellar motor switch protein FliN [Candidatus Zixiibacteriota bacterium]|nr:MAG: flagellar motor switch protein FliN [candidate division Zixibacteria bacterium]
MPDDMLTNEPQDDQDIPVTPVPPPESDRDNSPAPPAVQAVPSDQIETVSGIDDEVERIMLEELARAESADATPSAPDSEIEMPTPASKEIPVVKPVEFGKFDRTESTGQPKNIEILMDVKLPVAIELGHTELTIRDILGLSAGSVVELNKLAGEPVDLLVNNKTIARVEVVVVDENFGLRVTSLISPEDRIKSL